MSQILKGRIATIYGECWIGGHTFDLEAFASRLAAEMREAVEAEREACAGVCEDTVTFSEEHINYAPDDPEIRCGWCDGLEKAAAAIRARNL